MAIAGGNGTCTTKSRRTRADMDSIRAAIIEVLEADQPCTCRQCFYRLVVMGAVEKTEGEYKRTVCRLLLEMRLRNEIPFSWIADNTRWVRKPETFDSAESALRETARTYRKALWTGLDVDVQMFCEKDALATVLYEETARWDVPLAVVRGFSSVTFLHTLAGWIADTGKPTYLYHFGDHDPSGVLVDRQIESRIRQFAPEADVHFERVAVTEEQIALLNLPRRPTKTENNAHAKRWRGGGSVEVDAIPPRLLRAMVLDCIERHVSLRDLEAVRRTEAGERETLEKIVKAMTAVAS